jgi:serine/threonine protein kinase
MFPEVFHGFKILAHCGGGAYGDVYYCEDISGKKMALKVISKLRLGNNWERELKGVRNFHKITSDTGNLLQIFHVDEDDEYFFYTMECADSTDDTRYIPDTLALRLKNGPVPADELPDMISGIFDAVKTLHRAGFTHRDIKPDNILFVNGKPKLADIGLLSSLSGTVTMMAGTLDFIPPELKASDLLNSSDRKSRLRNDLYAFGKVIYCAATGMTPDKFPSIPKDLPLYLPVKYFFNLSTRLSNRDPGKRINNINALEQEIKDIRRKLLYGETLTEHIQESAGKFGRGLLRLIASFLIIILITLSAISLAGLGASIWVFSRITAVIFWICSLFFCLYLGRKLFQKLPRR